jgi:hypothetical protein
MSVWPEDKGWPQDIGALLVLDGDRPPRRRWARPDRRPPGSRRQAAALDPRLCRCGSHVPSIETRLLAKPADRRMIEVEAEGSRGRCGCVTSAAGARAQTSAVCARLGTDGSEHRLRALDAVLVDTSDPWRRLG